MEKKCCHTINPEGKYNPHNNIQTESPNSVSSFIVLPMVPHRRQEGGNLMSFCKEQKGQVLS